MKYIILVITLLVSTSIYASPRGDTNLQVNAPKFSTVQKVNQRVNTMQKQGQGQEQGQGQAQGLTNEIISYGRKNKRFAPGFGLASMFPSSICMGTRTVAGSFWLGGLGGGTTYEVDLCMQIETIRAIGYMIQNTLPTVAGLLRREKLEKGSIEVLCMTTWASKSPTLCPEQVKAAQSDTSTGSPTASPERKAKLGDLFKWTGLVD